MTLEALIDTLKEDKFYGDVLIKMEHGKVVLVKKTESIKLSE